MVLQQEANKQLIHQRLSLFRFPVLFVFLILAARLWQLQIIHGSEYALKAERNRVRRIELVAPRGEILDRNRKLLVENRTSSDVLLYREWMKDKNAAVQFLEQKLEVSAEDIEKRFHRGKSAGLYYPIVIKEDAGMRDISVIEAYRGEFPEIQISLKFRRRYCYGNLAAHVLGYVGEITEAEIEANRFPGAKPGSVVGQSGVERSYNQLLTGRDGERQVFVDSRGREVGLIGETDPLIGSELQLTLDLDLQLIAERALAEKVGAIVAMDPRNGEILAMASSPSFDPNAFSSRISEEAWRSLTQHPDHPMQNRAIQNSYSPGSIFKLIMAVAGLEEGMLDGDPSVNCRGYAVYYGRIYRCASKTGHGPIKLEQAIAKSCNVFFYELGKKLGISRIARHAQAFGLGQPTGIDLPGERQGIMPSPEWKMKARGSAWYAGETISVSIGQGAVNTTPLQILRAVSAIATGGNLVTPHVLLAVDKNDGGSVEWPVKKIPIAERNVHKIREGMWQSVNNWGTGHNAAVPGLDICGKTGTAQVIGSDKGRDLGEEAEDHSWFAGYANKDDPEIAVVVFIEHGGKGGVASAPIAKELFSAYLEKQKPKSITGDESRTSMFKESTRGGPLPFQAKND